VGLVAVDGGRVVGGGRHDVPVERMKGAAMTLLEGQAAGAAFVVIAVVIIAWLTNRD
jgi:hypothetical protein